MSNIYDLPENLEKYFRIALNMNSFPIGVDIPISELAKKAGVHINTAKKGLLFFYELNKIGIPTIKFIPKRSKIIRCPNCGYDIIREV